MWFSVYFVLGQSIVIGPSDFEWLFLNSSIGIRARRFCYAIHYSELCLGFYVFLLWCYCSRNAIFHFLLLITISFLFLLLLSFYVSVFIFISVSFTFLFIYVSASCFIYVFCLNLWKAKYSGVVSFWGRSPTLFEVLFIMCFPGSFPFTS